MGNGEILFEKGKKYLMTMPDDVRMSMAEAQFDQAILAGFKNDVGEACYSIAVVFLALYDTSEDDGRELLKGYVKYTLRGAEERNVGCMINAGIIYYSSTFKGLVKQNYNTAEKWEKAAYERGTEDEKEIALYELENIKKKKKEDMDKKMGFFGSVLGFLSDIVDS